MNIHNHEKFYAYLQAMKERHIMKIGTFDTGFAVVHKGGRLYLGKLAFNSTGLGVIHVCELVAEGCIEPYTRALPQWPLAGITVGLERMRVCREFEKDAREILDSVKKGRLLVTKTEPMGRD